MHVGHHESTAKAAWARMRWTCHGAARHHGSTSARHSSWTSSTSLVSTRTKALPAELSSKLHSHVMCCCLAWLLLLFSTAPAAAVRVSRTRVPSLPASQPLVLCCQGHQMLEGKTECPYSAAESQKCSWKLVCSHKRVLTALARVMLCVISAVNTRCID